MQCISYRNQIIPHFPFQKSRPDKRIDFSLANFDCQATKLLAPSISVQTHAHGSG